MQVLVYGEWQNQSKNIKPFFTASYSDSEKEIVQKTDFEEGVNFIFVGSLTAGKNPLYAIKLIQKLINSTSKIKLNIYGEGSERVNLERYIVENQLENHVFLHGNQNKETLKSAYKKSHFVILPSKSEGWPKAIAEGMFWGCIPVVTKISCVSNMLDYGKRGVFLENKLDLDIGEIKKVLNSQSYFQIMASESMKWAHQFTVEKFDSSIKELMRFCS